MAKGKGKGRGKPRVLIERNSDIADWGEKDVRGAYSRPLTIAGEQVDIDSLPALSDNDAPVDGGKTKAPLLPPGSP